MKKLLKIGVLTVLIAVMLSFAGCGVSQKSADKINDAVNNGEPMTVGEVKDKFGDPTEEALFAGTGYMVYINGCKEWEDFETKINNGDKVAGMVVICVGGKATAAVYYDNYEGQTK